MGRHTVHVRRFRPSTGVERVGAAFLVLLVALSASCADSDPDSVAVNRSADEPRSLSLGLVPAVDILPILAADEYGYFSDAGLELDYEIFTNPQDRQTALQTGTVDGALTDLVALILNVDGGFPIAATTMTSGMFAVVGRPGINPDERASIGLMQVSVTNYLADTWLAGRFELEKIYINDIAVRLESAANGLVDLAVLPEPLATVAQLRGLSAYAYSDSALDTPQIIAFTADALRTKSEAVRRFHEAYDRAAALLRSDESTARRLLPRAIANLTPETSGSVRLPEYRNTALPDAEYLENLIAWTAAATSRPIGVRPEDLVDRRFTD